MEYTQKPVTPFMAVKFLKYSAKLHGKSVPEFCEFVGIGKSTLSRWRNKKSIPSHTTLSRIQHANDLLKDFTY